MGLRRKLARRPAEDDFEIDCEFSYHKVFKRSCRRQTKENPSTRISTSRHQIQKQQQIDISKTKYQIQKISKVTNAIIEMVECQLV